MIGETDEFVPKSVDRAVLAKRMQSAAGPQARAVVVSNGNHKLEGQEKATVQYVAEFLERITKS